MEKLLFENNSYQITLKRKFKPIMQFAQEDVIQSFDFAYDMTFGKMGGHRDHRSGGSFHRNKGEIFADAFQGKLAEFGFKRFYDQKYGIRYGKLSAPSLECWELGIWDMSDFELGDKKIAVKSSKYYSNLLLLEQKDWTAQGFYIPNKDCSYYMIVLVRICKSISDILKAEKISLRNEEEYEHDYLKNIVCNKNTWSFDIPGYIKNEDLIIAIENGQIIKKGSILNKKTIMDADNYYIQTGDLKEWPDIH